jgi:hypothetical protein
MMRKCFLLLSAAALFPATGSAQLVPAPAPPGPGLSSTGNTLSVIYGTTAGTAAQGNDSRIVGAVQASGGNASATLVTAAGGTTARTLAVRAAQDINVLDEGADPTGATSSFTAFTNAATLAGTTGKTVRVPPGTYELPSAWVASSNGVTWEFEGTLFTGVGGITSIDWSAWLASLMHGWLGSTNRPGNSFGLVDQYLVNVTGATSDYEKDAAYFSASTSDPSTYTQAGTVDGGIPTWGGASVTKDTVGAHLQGNISSGNLAGRAWGVNAVASAANGGDGGLAGVEVDLVNNATSAGFNGAANGDQPYLDQPNSKVDGVIGVSPG